MLEELKREVFEANLALVRHGLVTLTFGNVSAIDRGQGIYAIKPSGVPYDNLTSADIVLVDLDGRQVEVGLKPSSDSPTHRCLYLAFSGIGGVAHTHSVYATAFAQAGRPIPMFGTTHADFFSGDIPVTRQMTSAEINGGHYEWETGNVITELFSPQTRTHLDTPAVLVNRHGPFTWGATACDAVENAVAVDFVARLALISLQLQPGLPTVEPELRAKHFTRKHGGHAYYGQKS
jgi:L-ribulose-5-phosphate 4-epimerase